MPVVQQMIGKLYVLSLFYMMCVALTLLMLRWFIYYLSNAQPLQPDERPTTFISTLTVPTEVLVTFPCDARGRDISCGEISAERGLARSVNFVV